MNEMGFENSLIFATLLDTRLNGPALFDKHLFSSYIDLLIAEGTKLIEEEAAANLSDEIFTMSTGDSATDPFADLYTDGPSSSANNNFTSSLSAQAKVPDVSFKFVTKLILSYRKLQPTLLSVQKLVPSS